MILNQVKAFKCDHTKSISLPGFLARPIINGILAVVNWRQKTATRFTVYRLDGQEYLHRWFVIPRNRFFNAYLHEFVNSDDDTPHDHASASVGIILTGQYVEQMITEPNKEGKIAIEVRCPGDIIFRKASAIHRIDVFKTTKTLFISGPKYRNWGFWCEKTPGQFIAHEDYLGLNGRSQKHCD